MKNSELSMKECIIYPVITLDQLRLLFQCRHIIKSRLTRTIQKTILHVIINDMNNGIANLLKILSLKNSINKSIHLIEIADLLTTLLISNDLNEKEHALYELSYYEELYGEQLVHELISICREKLETATVKNARKSLEEIISNSLGIDVSVKFFSDFPTCSGKTKALEILKCIIINYFSNICPTTILLSEELMFLKKKIPVRAIIINCE